MANTLLTPSIIAKEALMRLNANAVMAGLVYRNYSNEFQKVGDTITVRKPAEFEANEFNGSISVQDAKETAVTVKLDHHADVSFAVTSKELALSVQDFGAQFLEPAMEAIAQKIDRALTGLYADVGYAESVSGTPALSDFANVRKVLGINKAPMGNRAIVLDPVTEAKYNTLPAIVNAEKSGSTAALREASMGRILGFDTYMDQNIVAATGGAVTGTLSVKAQTNAGATSIVITGASGSAAVGDIIKVAGDSQGYVVTEAATASSGDITVKVSPAVQTTLSASAAVTYTSCTGSNNIAFHRNAFALVTRPLELPMGSSNAAIMNYNGFGLRVVYDYDISAKKDVISIDTLFGVKTLTPEMACRLIG